MSKKYEATVTTADELKALATECVNDMQATRPGWFWTGYGERNGTNRASTELAYWGQLGVSNVMAFKRRGMGGAKPVFYNYTDSGLGLAEDLEDTAIYEVEHRDDIVAYDNPVAKWIAAADPASILALIEDNERLRAEAKEFTGLITVGGTTTFRRVEPRRTWRTLWMVKR